MDGTIISDHTESLYLEIGLVNHVVAIGLVISSNELWFLLFPVSS